MMLSATQDAVSLRSSGSREHLQQRPFAAQDWDNLTSHLVQELPPKALKPLCSLGRFESATTIEEVFASLNAQSVFTSSNSVANLRALSIVLAPYSALPSVKSLNTRLACEADSTDNLPAGSFWKEEALATPQACTLIAWKYPNTEWRPFADLYRATCQVLSESPWRLELRMPEFPDNNPLQLRSLSLRCDRIERLFGDEDTVEEDNIVFHRIGYEVSYKNWHLSAAEPAATLAPLAALVASAVPAA